MSPPSFYSWLNETVEAEIHIPLYLPVGALKELWVKNIPLRKLIDVSSS